MPFIQVSSIIGFLLCLTPSLSASELTTLTPQERRDISQDLKLFYGSPTKNPSPMQRGTPKYDARTGEQIHPNAPLLLAGKPPANPLLRLAQGKGTEAFRRAKCEYYGCDPVHGLDAKTEKHDRIEQLIETWIRPEGLTKVMDELPRSGKTNLALWSSDVWRMRYGGISYRYSGKLHHKSYQEAVEAYSQPQDWNRTLGGTNLSELVKVLALWSPAEKYDLSVGDEKFNLTNMQKERGKGFLEKGDVPGWIGMCHGWASAAIMVPPPKAEVTVVGPQGVPVVWNPSDIRGITSLYWGEGPRDINFIGGRCEAVNPETYPNGRLVKSECFDTNPATFHLALTNLVGRYRHSFIMDKSYDYQVWNQPIHSYRIQYFSPLNPERKSDDWAEVATEYDATFKRSDRFQVPLTRGEMRGGRYDDSSIHKVVGVIATVVYAAAHEPQHGPNPGDERFARETYLYDLEIEAEGGKWVPTGGEWHKNAHPDFLWLPRRGSVVVHAEDKLLGPYSTKLAPPSALGEAAAKASRDGAPLCSVVKTLAHLSGGAPTIRCHNDPDTSDWLAEIPATAPVRPTRPTTPPVVVNPGCRPDAPATIIVKSVWPNVPFWIQGQPMGDLASSGTRTLTTAALSGCRSYTYQMRFHAPRLVEGRYYYQTQELTVRFNAGETVVVRLDREGNLHVERP